MTEQETIITKLLDWVLDIDTAAIAESVSADKEKYPHMSKRALAEKGFVPARIKATAIGFITGLPINIVSTVPSALLDATTLLKVEINATARTALIYDEYFFDNNDAKWELLIPVFGVNVFSQMARKMGVRGSIGVTRFAIKRWLAKTSLKRFQRIVSKYFGIKVTQRAVISKTLPIIGGLIGGTWNYIEVTRVKKRAIDYFENLEIT